MDLNGFLKDLSIDKVRNLAEDAFNQAKPKTEVEARVYEVLSHKNWGASSSLMNEIANDSYDYEKFAIISQLMWESMENQRPAAWRVVFKGLCLLEHLIKNGSERCVDDARNHGHALRALTQFNYYEGTVDRGLGVREKTKQIQEILGDDERIREERTKAKQLREKFGVKMSGVSSSGATSGGGRGGGGGGGSSGYGQDNWESRGTSGGYGDGGIGSSGRSGGGGGGGRASNSAGNRGRYDDQDTRPARGAEPTPTFAAMPDINKPKKVKKKKKKPEAAAAPAADVDLFSFDDPTPAQAPAASGGGDDFADFQSAGGGQSAPTNDPFATTAPQQQNTQFDAFGGQAAVAAPPMQHQTAQFDAFGGQSMGGGGGGGMNNNAFPMGGGMNGGNGMSGGNGMMQQQQMPMNGGMGMNQSAMRGGMSGGGMNGGMNGGMGGGMQQQSQPPQKQQAEDDDFGDFADAAPKQGASSGGDPMSNLFSLDGLTKNATKQESKINQPIIANPAAAQFVQEKEQIQATMQQGKKGSSMSFVGIDGLNNNSGMGQMSMLPPMPMTSMGSNPSVMGNSGASSIGMMMDPQSMQQPSGGMNTGNQLQGGMNMGNMGMQQNGGMGNMSMQQGGMQNGGVRQQNGGMQQGNMGNMGMQQQNGGMQNGGMMNPQMGMMNNQMGNMNQGNMNNMNMNMGNMNNMGGQQQQGNMGGGWQ